MSRASIAARRARSDSGGNQLDLDVQQLGIESPGFDRGGDILDLPIGVLGFVRDAGDAECGVAGRIEVVDLGAGCVEVRAHTFDHRLHDGALLFEGVRGEAEANAKDSDSHGWRWREWIMAWATAFECSRSPQSGRIGR